jgi:TATA-box binding protein (TBP) (component of TFIID and TFIIIB)
MEKDWAELFGDDNLYENIEWVEQEDDPLGGDYPELQRVLEELDRDLPPPRREEALPGTPPPAQEDDDEAARPRRQEEEIRRLLELPGEEEDEEAVDLPPKRPLHLPTPFVKVRRPKKRKKRDAEEGPRIVREMRMDQPPQQRQEQEVVMPSVSNIVIHVDLGFGGKLSKDEMRSVAENLEYHDAIVTYEPSKHAAVRVKKGSIENAPSSAVMLFPQGKLVVTGNSSKKAILEIIKIIKRRLSEHDIETKEVTNADISVNNIVANVQLPYTVRLTRMNNGLIDAGNLDVRYEPELQNYLKLDIRDGDEKLGTCTIFTSGKVNFLGFKTKQDIEKAFRIVLDLTNPYKGVAVDPTQQKKKKRRKKKKIGKGKRTPSPEEARPRGRKTPPEEARPRDRKGAQLRHSLGGGKMEEHAKYRRARYGEKKRRKSLEDRKKKMRRVERQVKKILSELNGGSRRR